MRFQGGTKEALEVAERRSSGRVSFGSRLSEGEDDGAEGPPSGKVSPTSFRLPFAVV